MTVRDPNDVAAYDEDMAKSWVGPPPTLRNRIEIRDYDPEWPRLFEREAARVRSVLGDRVVRLEHAGSTSVPGLPAKPIIDLGLYVRTKRELAARDWKYVRQYADAKCAVVQEIMARADAAAR